MTTINKEEIQKFSKLANEWWDVEGKFKPLHMFNPIRIEYILEKIRLHFNLPKNKNNILKELKILDIGCGGGLMSEPMARLGAKVTGIDASSKNISIAEIHSKKSNLSIKYLNKSPEQLKNYEEYDVILNLEIVEHVEDVDLYIQSCQKLIKKNGIILYMVCSFLEEETTEQINLFLLNNKNYIIEKFKSSNKLFDKLIDKNGYINTNPSKTNDVYHDGFFAAKLKNAE